MTEHIGLTSIRVLYDIQATQRLMASCMTWRWVTSLHLWCYSSSNKQCGRPPHYAPTPCKLTLKVISESRVTWATSVSSLVFLGLSDLDLGPMYATDVRQTDRQTSDAHHRLMPRYGDGGITIRDEQKSLSSFRAVGFHKMHSTICWPF